VAQLRIDASTAFRCAGAISLSTAHSRRAQDAAHGLEQSLSAASRSHKGSSAAGGVSSTAGGVVGGVVVDVGAVVDGTGVGDAADVGVAAVVDVVGVVRVVGEGAAGAPGSSLAASTSPPTRTSTIAMPTTTPEPEPLGCAPMPDDDGPARGRIPGEDVGGGTKVAAGAAGAVVESWVAGTGGA
jgi:hypothetical protein